MQHFKEFLLLVQSLDIQIGQMSATSHGSQQQVNYYDISHENPFLNASFKNQLKELKELAITDILNMPGEQILNQLQRLETVKAGFLKFWEKYYHLPFPMGSKQNLEVIYNLNLNNIFICPQLTFMDQATASDSFIDDLETTIRHRQSILNEFEAEVLKIIHRDKEGSTLALLVPVSGNTRSTPVFKIEIVDEVLTLVQGYFSVSDHQILKQLLAETDSVITPIVFNGPGNQLADAFKQLFDSNLIVGCNKAELESWIQQNFRYQDKGTVKSYTGKYLQDIISSNSKACQSPLFDVRKMGDSFTCSRLEEIQKIKKISGLYGVTGVTLVPP